MGSFEPARWKRFGTAETFQILRHRYTPIVVYGWRMFRRTMESLQVWHDTDYWPLVNGRTVHSMVHTS